MTDAVIALLTEQGDRQRAFIGELGVIATRLGITTQVATKLQTILGHRLWGHYESWSRHEQPPETLAQLLTRTFRHSVTRGSKSWLLLRVWLAEHGFPDLDESDGRPRCAHCGALLRGATLTG